MLWVKVCELHKRWAFPIPGRGRVGRMKRHPSTLFNAALLIFRNSCANPFLCTLQCMYYYCLWQCALCNRMVVIKSSLHPNKDSPLLTAVLIFVMSCVHLKVWFYVWFGHFRSRARLTPWKMTTTQPQETQSLLSPCSCGGPGGSMPPADITLKFFPGMAGVF